MIEEDAIHFKLFKLSIRELQGEILCFQHKSVQRTTWELESKFLFFYFFPITTVSNNHQQINSIFQSDT